MEAIIGFILRDRAGDLARAAMFGGGFLFITSAVGNVVMKALSAQMVTAGKPAPTARVKSSPTCRCSSGCLRGR